MLRAHTHSHTRARARTHAHAPAAVLPCGPPRRPQVKGARLLANPGCYPTCSQLPLYPLVKAKLILPDDIIIDAKSGG